MPDAECVIEALVGAWLNDGEKPAAKRLASDLASTEGGSSANWLGEEAYRCFFVTHDPDCDLLGSRSHRP